MLLLLLLLMLLLLMLLNHDMFSPSLPLLSDFTVKANAACKAPSIFIAATSCKTGEKSISSQYYYIVWQQQQQQQQKQQKQHRHHDDMPPLSTGLALSTASFSSSITCCCITRNVLQSNNKLSPALHIRRLVMPLKRS